MAFTNIKTAEVLAIEAYEKSIADKLQELRVIRDASLTSMVHIFSDGRTIQVRPSDASNIQFGIATGQSEWVMKDNYPHPVTTAELQEAFDSGIAQGVVIWADYMTAIKAI